MNVKTRDITIDVAKGIGILLVVYGYLNNPIPHFVDAFYMPLFNYHS